MILFCVTHHILSFNE